MLARLAMAAAGRDQGGGARLRGERCRACTGAERVHARLDHGFYRAREREGAVTGPISHQWQGRRRRRRQQFQLEIKEKGNGRGGLRWWSGAGLLCSLNARMKEGGRREYWETAGGHHGIAAMRTEEEACGGGRS
jgi:hypothetical protein